jgi:protein-S-isoprenylcysteine O-methyltransferase Ste14
MNTVTGRRLVAVFFGVLCHGLFVVAVSLMARELFHGMTGGRGPFTGVSAALANGLLLLQFPILHSLLLTRPGMRLLERLAPSGLGSALAPTSFALVAALQLGLTFYCWSPTGIEFWMPEGPSWVLHTGAFLFSWLFLGKALMDAGLGLQTGWIGWTAVWSNRKPRYPGIPSSGLFSTCRQPIYLGFAMILWTAPAWTLDHLVLALVWSAYCVIGPIHKEHRFKQMFGREFDEYRRRVPYILPRVSP